MSKAKVANHYFDFKKFRINQSRAAMKVTTEGCILGAWTASLGLMPKRILDIGAGTGLLSLMLAQQYYDAEIDAVELDENAIADARENFEMSPWADRLTLIHKPIQKLKSSQKYDLIISNPPFYKESLKSPSSTINSARHDDSLSKQDLVSAITQQLSDTGHCTILYPEREMKDFISTALSHGLFLNRSLTIFNRIPSPVFRQIGVFSKDEEPFYESELSIRNAKNEYTPEFISLLRVYYLYL